MLVTHPVKAGPVDKQPFPRARWGPLAMALVELKVGQCRLIKPYDPDLATRILGAAKKTVKIKVTTKKQDGGVMVWRIE